MKQYRSLGEQILIYFEITLYTFVIIISSVLRFYKNKPSLKVSFLSFSSPSLKYMKNIYESKLCKDKCSNKFWFKKCLSNSIREKILTDKLSNFISSHF